MHVPADIQTGFGYTLTMNANKFFNVNEIDQDPRYRLVRRLIAMRLLVVTAAFVAGHYLYGPPNGFYGVIALFYAINFVHLALLRWKSRLFQLSEIKLVVDIMLTTGLVHYTGGIDSVFVFLYPLSILSAAAISPHGILPQTMAAASTLFFGILVLLEYTGVLDHFGGVYSSYEKGAWLTAFLYFFRVFIFGLVAALSGFFIGRLRAEQSRLRNIQDFSSQMLGRMNHGMITTDASDRIVYANEYALDILSCEFTDIAGKDWHTLFKSRQMYDPGMEDVVDAMDPGRNEACLAVASPGGEKTVGFNFSHQYDEKGALVSKVILFRDLTEMLRMNKRLKAAEKWVLMGELAAGIVHEIRNPLACIRGSIEVLKRRRVFKPQDNRMLEVILQESDRLNAILEDYLVYTHRRTQEPKDWDPAVIVDGVLSVVKGHPRVRKDIRLHWYPGECKALVCVDDQKIRQVLLNILQNAMDAMPRGGDLTVRMSLAGGGPEAAPQSNVSTLGQWVRLDIEDTGEGMPQDILDRLYEPFFSTKQNGHGIGLALCRRIVENHQGFLDVKSKVGEGTVFSVYLPVAPEMLRSRNRAG